MTLANATQIQRHRFDAVPALRLIDNTATAEADDNDAAPLANVVQQFARELEADGLLAAWHERRHEPVPLFASGDCVRSSDLERDMIEVATQCVDARVDRSRSAWCATTDGPESLLTTAIPSAKGIITLTAFFRAGRSGLRVRGRDTVARLLPLVQPFFHLWEMRSDTLSKLRGLTAAINNSDVATVLVNREGKTLFANDAAELLIAARDGLTRSGATLRCTQLADTLRLHAAIDHALDLESIGAADSGITPVVALERTRGRPLLAAIVASKHQAAEIGEAVATVYIFDPEQDLHARLEPACKLYGLSPVETRLTCLLAGGGSLADAATAMHIRGQTARSYLKQIFLKTDTNRQAELVWMMLKSSVRTAPGRRTMLI